VIRTRRPFATEYKVGAAAARNEKPLAAARRMELARVHKQVVEQDKDTAFLKVRLCRTVSAVDRCL
jgi:hypothetical protein